MSVERKNARQFIVEIFKLETLIYTGVQRINNVFHIVDKVENVCVNKYIFDLIDNVEYVVYALYSCNTVF